MSARGEGRAYAAWAAVCFFWGTGFLAIRIGAQGAPPLLFAGLRILAAGLALTLWLRARGEPLPPRHDWRSLAVVGLALEACANGSLAWAGQRLPGGMLALLFAMSPFWMAGLEALLPGGERLAPGRLLGLLVGFAGLALLLAPGLGGAGLGGAALPAVLLLQAACLAWAAGSIYARRRPAAASPWMAAALQMTVAGAALTLAGSLAGEWARFRPEPRALGAMLYLALFGSLVGYSCYLYSLRRLPVAIVSLYAYVNPLVAVLLGWALLGERLSGAEIAGAGTILAGLALVRRAARKGPGLPAVPEPAPAPGAPLPERSER